MFDEIEKAHPDVLNALLQVLDDGRLTDGQGKTVNFRNTVLIMTSNLGSSLIQSGESDSKLQQQMQGVLRGHFKPEFLNRIDDIIIFNALGIKELRQVVRIQLQELQARLAEKKIEIELSSDALELIANHQRDDHFGARPIKRAIQSLIEDPLATLIIEGRVHEGDKIWVQRSGEILSLGVNTPPGKPADVVAH